MIVSEATQMVNSRLIARSTGDPESGGPITPLHLQLGCASVEVSQMRLDETPRLMQWMQQVFRGRVLSHKGTKEVGEMAIRDVVLLAEVNPTYRAS
jgi:hypothetical protein